MSSAAGFAFKKRFGQHFLRDTGVIDRIVRLVGPSSEELFLEVGAGDGALSTRLASCAGWLLAVERDPSCIPLLEAALRPFPSAKILEGDILEMDISAALNPYLGRFRLRVAGNLPYNIATAIIEKLLGLCLPATDMTFMVQLEVARRITASPGCSEYGLLSAYCQHLGDVRIALTVSPACFVPRPRVKSAVIVIRPQPPVWDPRIEERFCEILKAAFGYRRKKLANSFRRHPVTGPIADELLRRVGIDGSRRAEEVTVREYEDLARASMDF